MPTKMIKNPQTGRMVKRDGVIGKQIQMERKLKRGTYKPVSDKGRGGRVRGWSTLKPNRGKERHELINKCGYSCFLRPETESFPICAAVSRSSKGELCKPQCSGIVSAKVRASQWGYSDVTKRANKLEKKHKCLKKKKASASPKRSSTSLRRSSTSSRRSSARSSTSSRKSSARSSYTNSFNRNN